MIEDAKELHEAALKLLNAMAIDDDDEDIIMTLVSAMRSMMDTVEGTEGATFRLHSSRSTS